MPHHPALRRASCILYYTSTSLLHHTSHQHHNYSHNRSRNHKHNHNDVHSRSTDQYEREGLQQIPCKTMRRRRVSRGKPSCGTGPTQEARGANPVLHGEKHIVVLWVQQVHLKGHKSNELRSAYLETHTDCRSAISWPSMPRARSPAPSAASSQARTTMLVFFLGLKLSLLNGPTVASPV